MASLKTLLEQRNQQQVRGSEDLRGGQMFYYAFTNPESGICQFCWISPGTGVAVVELWGASGSGAMMCCCSTGVGLPGNPGAYSKKTIPVTTNTYICGFVGCSPTTQTLYAPVRSGCSVACIVCAPSNYTMIAQGGSPGYLGCTTSTASYCCLAGSGFCATLQATYCGIVCNLGGPCVAVAATASGGDVNISGGISCTQISDCTNSAIYGYKNTVALSPGIYSSSSDICVRFDRGAAPFGNGYNQSGRYVQANAINALRTGMSSPSACWSGAQDCGCYQFSGCTPIGVGIPGVSGLTCGGQRTDSVRGGPGAVKITYYT